MRPAQTEPIPWGLAALALLGLFLSTPPSATALAPAPAEIEAVVTLPLAVDTVSRTAVEPVAVERVVTRLNEARVPVADTVEIVRYTPFELVVHRVRPADGLAVDLPVELDGLDMLHLLDRHLDRGLEGPALAAAVLSDLLVLGFDVGTGERWRAAPLPVEPDFLYYVEPGYRFATDRGLFVDRVVTVENDWVRDDVWRDRDGWGRRAPAAALPPGHVKHDRPGGPPGHVRHDGPGGPPGHAKHDPDRIDRRGRAGGPPSGRKAGAARDRGPKGPPPGRVQDDRGRGQDGGPGKKARGQGDGKGKGKGKGGGGR